jgi:tetratricopeptide (TPR) repeat protein
MADKNADKAMPVWENAVAWYPDYLFSYDILFRLYDARKEYDKTYKLAKRFIEIYDMAPGYVLKDTTVVNSGIVYHYQGKFVLKFSIDYLYQNSLARNDTATNRDAYRRMQQLHIN